MNNSSVLLSNPLIHSHHEKDPSLKNIVLISGVILIQNAGRFT